VTLIKVMLTSLHEVLMKQMPPVSKEPACLFALK
jgi:hypothetical protein